MALAFNKTKGKASKNSHEAYKYADGENAVRLVGGILPSYIYWLKGSNNKDIPVECLAFDRDQEKFTNVEVDHVPEYFPDKKCSWAYRMNCIDLKDGKVKVLNLKKKLFEQIIATAEDLGDPTDPDTGWDAVFKKVKTGPLPFNVEYTLSVLRCKKRPLTDAEREAVANSISIDEKFPRPKAEDVKATLEKILAGAATEDEDTPTADKEAVADLAN